MTEADKTVAELMALADARELARKRQYECERYINTCEDTAEDRAELVRLQQARVEADRAFEQAIRRAVERKAECKAGGPCRYRGRVSAEFVQEHQRAVDAQRQALGDSQPVAWQMRWETQFASKSGQRWSSWQECADRKATDPLADVTDDGTKYEFRALYASPQRADLGMEARRIADAIAAAARAALPAPADQHPSTDAPAGVCLPHGLPLDAFGEPRVRYVRVTLDGSHMVDTPKAAEQFVQDAKDAGDESVYTLTDVYLSEREFDDLPEFDGF